MKLIPSILLLLVTLLVSCVSPYDNLGAPPSGSYYSSSPAGGYNNGYRPVSYNTRSNEDSINPWAVVGAGMLALWALDGLTGGSSSPSEASYDRCQLCSQEANWTGYCGQHASMLQAQMNQSR